MSDWKSRLGVVYSTNPDFNYTTETDVEEEQETLPAAQQPLRLSLSTAHRKGKTVTLVTGFIGKEADLHDLAKMLRTKLSTGGSDKDGEIILQGDCRKAVLELLKKEGYSKAK
ncbi:MAG: translation initiation factor [Bacteroidaceae bacterium]|nr:translation initiation factor [Bacteroidaceae bacterium]